MPRQEPYYDYSTHKTLDYTSSSKPPPRITVYIIICASPSLTAPGTSHAALLFSFPSSSSSSSSSALVAHIVSAGGKQVVELKSFKSVGKVVKGGKGGMWGGGRVEIALELGEFEKGVGRGEVEDMMLGTGKGKGEGGAWPSSQRWVYAAVKMMEREKGWLAWGGTDRALKKMEDVMGKE